MVTLVTFSQEGQMWVELNVKCLILLLITKQFISVS